MTDWNRLPDEATVRATMDALRERNFLPRYVPTRDAALAALQEMVPPGTTVAHGTSTTLIQVGFLTFIEQAEGYDYLPRRVRAEDDPERRTRLRKEATLADYFLGGVQAIAQTGQVVAADASGGRQAGYIYGANHVIWVAGVNKIVPTLDDALRRLREHAFPLEDQRMKQTGAPGSSINKVVIYERESVAGRTQVLLIGEALGF
ncbi:MAG: lactate utilization protein [Chloroflexi bacterium]|nr:lactate utilization protein [Chloroflexota bacterium]